ncbi:MAG: DUF3450 domain-containing protein [Mailhella sp.]|nr:DUF3450 domain-containing protein [Mailhella sp.]
MSGKIPVCAAALATVLLAVPVYASTADKVQDHVTKAVRAEAAVQRKIDEWHVQRDDMLEDIRMLKLETQWLELQEKKLRRYVENNQRKIHELEEAQGRYALIAMDLENNLLDQLAELKSIVAADLPFLAEERANRLRFLEETMDDHSLSIGEKYRRFAEALNAEAEYGKKLEMSSLSAQLDGRTTDLIVINAGRVGYYCLTADRKRAGTWSKTSGGFVSGDEAMLDAVRRLEEMASTKHYHDLVSLPLPVAEKTAEGAAR